METAMRYKDSTAKEGMSDQLLNDIHETSSTEMSL
jgi:hypothetical protein